MFRPMQIIPRVCRFNSMRNRCRGLSTTPWNSSRPLVPFRGNSLWDWPENRLWDWTGYNTSPFKAFDDHLKNVMNHFERAMGPGGEVHVKCTKTEYEVMVDVRHYDPEHIKINVTNDKLVISGRHEHKADNHGHVSREFTRQLTLPENVDTESMTSGLTNEGILYVRAKLKGSAEEGKEREIKINIDRDESAKKE